MEITLNPASGTLAVILGLYEPEFGAFVSMSKDYVRNFVFPKISDFVPSSTRQGAEAFLKAIRRTREVFEYEETDLTMLSSIFDDYRDGRISLNDAVERSVAATRTNVQMVDSQAAAKVSDIVPDVIANEAALQTENAQPIVPDLDAAPAIDRTELASSAKIMTLEPHETPLRGYRCLLALSDRVREQMGEFFFQPHRTSIVWGGQRAMFVFLHHSGRFGLYYDLQTREVISSASGGGPFPTCTIILKDRIYIPIPDELRAAFVPAPGERKRFEVRGDILRTEAQDQAGTEAAA